MAAWCPTCLAGYMFQGATECSDCTRRKSWGTVLGILATCRVVVLNDQLQNEVLAAVALLMQERQALVHQHRRDMMDEQRAASRGAGEAFDDGRDAGRREGRGDW